ncbi:MAG: transposase [Candidatus Omnitrophota bacterium]
MPFIARTHQLKRSLLYHIFNRGNAKNDIFHKIEDYQYFIGLLSSYSAKHKFLIYHWVLMPNHYHIVLEIEEPTKISSVMAGIARAYVHYHHKKYESAGYLWQGRFKSQPIQKETYLAACGRYVERNPVQANLTIRAWEYPYSSAAYYVLGKDDGLTVESPLFNSFGVQPQDRKEKYKEYLEAFNAEEVNLFENLEFPQGSEEFLKRLLKEKGLFIPRRQGRILK